MPLETTSVVFSGPILSLLALDSFVTTQKEGYLIGRVTVSEKTVITDADEGKHERHTTVAISQCMPSRVIDSVCTADSRFQFEDVEKSRVRYGFSDSQVKVIGWYRARRNSSLAPSCRESIAHRQLIDARARAAFCDSDRRSQSSTSSNYHNEPFIFALFVHSKTKAGAQHGLDYAAFAMQPSPMTNQRQDGAASLLSSVDVRVANLGDAPQSAYLPVSTFAMHSFGDLTGASRTLSSKLERYKRDSSDALLMRDMHNAAQESLNKLCSAIAQTALKQMTLRNEVQRLEAERLALLPKTSSTIEAVEEDEEIEELSRIASGRSSSASKSGHHDALRPELRQTTSDAQRRKSHNVTARTEGDLESTRAANQSVSVEKEKDILSSETSASSRTSSLSRQVDLSSSRNYSLRDADVNSNLNRSSGDRTPISAANRSNEMGFIDAGKSQLSSYNGDEQDPYYIRAQQSDRSKRPTSEFATRSLSEAAANMSISHSNSSRTSALGSGLGSSSLSHGANATLPVGSSNVHKYSSAPKESGAIKTNRDRDHASYRSDSVPTAASSSTPVTSSENYRDRNKEHEPDYRYDAPSNRDRDASFRSSSRAVSEKDERTTVSANSYGQSTLPKSKRSSAAPPSSPTGGSNSIPYQGTNLNVSGTTSHSRSGAKRE